MTNVRVLQGKWSRCINMGWHCAIYVLEKDKATIDYFIIEWMLAYAFAKAL